MGSGWEGVLKLDASKTPDLRGIGHAVTTFKSELVQYIDNYANDPAKRRIQSGKVSSCIERVALWDVACANGKTRRALVADRLHLIEEDHWRACGAK